MPNTKHCPYCGEEVLAVAKKCKHCGKWIDNEPVNTNPGAESVEQNTNTTNIIAESSDTSAQKENQVSPTNNSKQKKLILAVAGVILLVIIGGIIFAKYSSPRKIDGWELGYMKDANGVEDKTRPCVSKLFSTDKGDIKISFTREGFILSGKCLPAVCDMVKNYDSKTSTENDAELVEIASNTYEANYNKVRRSLAFGLEVEEPLMTLIEIVGKVGGETKSIPYQIDPKGGKGLEKAMAVHLVKNDDSNNINLQSWGDRLAYCYGVKYVLDSNLNTSVSLRTYLKSNWEDITGSSKFDDQLLVCAQQGFMDAYDGNTLLNKNYIDTFVELAGYEAAILKNERSIASENEPWIAQRFQISMNNNYKKLDALIKANPDINYWPDRIVNYAHKRDSILSLPPEMFIASSDKDAKIRYDNELKRLKGVSEQKIIYANGKNIWYIYKGSNGYSKLMSIYDSKTDKTSSIDINKTPSSNDMMTVKAISKHNGKLTFILEEMRNSNGWVEGTYVWTINCADQSWSNVAKGVAGAEFVKGGAAVKITTAKILNPDVPTFEQRYKESTKIISL